MMMQKVKMGDIEVEVGMEKVGDQLFQLNFQGLGQLNISPVLEKKFVLPTIPAQAGQFHFPAGDETVSVYLWREDGRIRAAKLGYQVEGEVRLS